jgi:DNA mismatch endonuclease (patch repair protein)
MSAYVVEMTARRRELVDHKLPPESWATSTATRRTMLGNRKRDTSPEMAVRQRVHGSGLRYRVCARPFPMVRRTADMVFRASKVAVFIDGCFWHSCPAHGRRPRVNTDYWIPKLLRNVERDREIDDALVTAGWCRRRLKTGHFRR